MTQSQIQSLRIQTQLCLYPQIPTIRVRFVECLLTRDHSPHNVRKISGMLYHNVKPTPTQRLISNIGEDPPNQKHAALTFMRIIFVRRAVSIPKQARFAYNVWTASLIISMQQSLRQSDATWISNLLVLVHPRKASYQIYYHKFRHFCSVRQLVLGYVLGSPPN
jgi:hypothetical protein